MARRNHWLRALAFAGVLVGPVVAYADEIVACDEIGVDPCMVDPALCDPDPCDPDPCVDPILCGADPMMCAPDPCFPDPCIDPEMCGADPIMCDPCMIDPGMCGMDDCLIDPCLDPELCGLPPEECDGFFVGEEDAGGFAGGMGGGGGGAQNQCCLVDDFFQFISLVDCPDGGGVGGPDLTERIVVVPFSQSNPSLPHPTHESGRVALKAMMRATTCNQGYDVVWDVNRNNNYDDDESKLYMRTAGMNMIWEIGRTFVTPDVDAGQSLNINVRATNRCNNNQTFNTYRMYAYDFRPSSDPREWTDNELSIMSLMTVGEVMWWLYREIGQFSGENVSTYSAIHSDRYTGILTQWLMAINSHLPAYPPGTINTYGRALPAGWRAENQARYENDPYAEASMRLLNGQTAQARIENRAVEAADESNECALDENGDPVLCNRIPGTADLRGASSFGNSQTYVQGMATGALAPLLPSLAGTPLQVGQGIRGQTWEWFEQQMVDYLVFIQMDGNGATDGAGNATGCDNGGFLYGPTGAGTCGRADASTSAWGFIGLESAFVAGQNYGVFVNNRARFRIVDYLMANQNADGGAGYRTNDNVSNFQLTGGAVLAGRWLGLDQFDEDDVDVPWPGQTDYEFTKGELRQMYDRYIQFTINNWESVQRRGSLGYVDGLWSDGDYLCGNTNGIYNAGKCGNTYGIYNYEKAAVGYPNVLDSFGPYDWLRQFNTYYTRAQDRGLNPTDPWDGYEVFGRIIDEYCDAHSVTCHNGQGRMATAMAGLIGTPSIFGSPPVASFRAQPNVVTEGCAGGNAGQVILDHSASFHPNPGERIIAYQYDVDAENGLWWDTGADPDAETPGPDGLIANTVPYVFNDVGVYIVTLRVIDSAGVTSTTTRTVEVREVENVPPSVAHGGPYIIETGDALQLAGTASDLNEACGDEITVGWDLDSDGVFDNAALANELVGWGAPLDGLALNVAHPIRLRAVDADGEEVVVETTLTIYPREPVAVGRANPNPAACPQEVVFDGSASYHPNPDRLILAHEWDIDGDDVIDGAGGIFRHSYNSFGTRTITLTVTDDLGRTDSTQFDLPVILGNLPPIARTSEDVYNVQEGNNLTLDGRNSSEPNTNCGDEIVEYAWDVNGDGDWDDAEDVVGANPVVLWADLAAAQNWIVENSPVETTVTLRVTDTFGEIATKEVLVRLFGNLPVPVCAQMPLPAPINLITGFSNPSLDARDSFSPTPGREIISYDWDLDGDGLYERRNEPVVEFIKVWDPLPADPDAIPPVTVGLRVIDNLGNMGTRTCDIIFDIPPTPPFADADPSDIPEQDYHILIGDGVTLDGSHSFDPDSADFGDYIISYRWDLTYDELDGFQADIELDDPDGDGGQDIVDLTAQELADHGINGPGDYVIALQIEDTTNLLGFDTAILHVYSPLPVAEATANPNPSACDERVTFDASASHNEHPDVDIVAWRWDIDGDGNYDDANGEVINWRFPQFSFDGPFQVGLEVEDDRGAIATTTVEVDVSLGNLAPVAIPGGQRDVNGVVIGPYVIAVGDNLQLSGVGSSDPNEDCGDSIVSYEWDLNNNGNVDFAGEIPAVLTWAQLIAQGIDQVGLYSVRLRVTDRFGAAGDGIATIRVVGGPQALAEADVNRVNCEGQVTLDGSNSIAGGPPNQGFDLVSWDWDLDGDGLYDDAAGQVIATAGIGLPGPDGSIHMIAGLQVTDQSGRTDAIEIDVIIEVQNLPPIANAGGPYETGQLAPGQFTDVHLDGRGSFDPNAPCDQVVEYRWDLDGDGVYGEDDNEPTTADFDYNNPNWQVNTTQTVRLVVCDGLGACSEPAEVEIEISPEAPPGGELLSPRGEDQICIGGGSFDVDMHLTNLASQYRVTVTIAGQQVYQEVYGEIGPPVDCFQAPLEICEQIPGCFVNNLCFFGLGECENFCDEIPNAACEDVEDLDLCDQLPGCFVQEPVCEFAFGEPDPCGPGFCTDIPVDIACQDVNNLDLCEQMPACFVNEVICLRGGGAPGCGGLFCDDLPNIPCGEVDDLNLCGQMPGCFVDEDPMGGPFCNDVGGPGPPPLCWEIVDPMECGAAPNCVFFNDENGARCEVDSACGQIDIPAMIGVCDNDPECYVHRITLPNGNVLPVSCENRFTDCSEVSVDECEETINCFIDDVPGSGLFCRQIQDGPGGPGGFDVCTDPFIWLAGMESFDSSLIGLDNNHQGSCGGDGAEEVIAYTNDTMVATPVCVDTLGSGGDTVLYVREECGIGESEIVCNDDGDDARFDLESQVEFIAEPGQTYSIFVDELDPGNESDFVINIAEGPCPLPCGDIEDQMTCEGTDGCYFFDDGMLTECRDIPACDGLAPAECGNFPGCFVVGTDMGDICTDVAFSGICNNVDVGSCGLLPNCFIAGVDFDEPYCENRDANCADVFVEDCEQTTTCFVDIGLGEPFCNYLPEFLPEECSERSLDSCGATPDCFVGTIRFTNQPMCLDRITDCDRLSVDSCEESPICFVDGDEFGGGNLAGIGAFCREQPLPEACGDRLPIPERCMQTPNCIIDDGVCFDRPAQGGGEERDLTVSINSLLVPEGRHVINVRIENAGGGEVFIDSGGPVTFDRTAPEITMGPEPAEGVCYNPLQVPEAIINVEDNIDPAPSVQQNLSADVCTQSLEVIAVDACGNSSTLERTYLIAQPMGVAIDGPNEGELVVDADVFWETIGPEECTNNADARLRHNGGAFVPYGGELIVEPGEYTFQVDVFNCNNGTATQTRNFVVNGPPIAVPVPAAHPAANLMNMNAYVVSEGDGLQLDCGDSLPPENIDFIANCEWDFDIFDGLTYEDEDGEIVPFSTEDDGFFLGAVKVIDSLGAEDTENFTITVLDVDPIADPGGPYIVTQGRELEVDGTGSRAGSPADAITSYTWNWGDGTPPTVGEGEDRPAHIYEEDGVYNLRLTVTDEDSAAVAVERVIVTDVNPLIEIVGLPENAVELFDFEIQIQVTEGAGRDPVERIEYDFNNDGVADCWWPNVDEDNCAGPDGMSATWRHRDAGQNPVVIRAYDPDSVAVSAVNINVREITMLELITYEGNSIDNIMADVAVPPFSKFPLQGYGEYVQRGTWGERNERTGNTFKAVDRLQDKIIETIEVDGGATIELGEENFAMGRQLWREIRRRYDALVADVDNEPHADHPSMVRALEYIEDVEGLYFTDNYEADAYGDDPLVVLQIWAAAYEAYFWIGHATNVCTKTPIEMDMRFRDPLERARRSHEDVNLALLSPALQWMDDDMVDYIADATDPDDPGPGAPEVELSRGVLTDIRALQPKRVGTICFGDEDDCVTDLEALQVEHWMMDMSAELNVVGTEGAYERQWQACLVESVRYRIELSLLRVEYACGLNDPLIQRGRQTQEIGLSFYDDGDLVQAIDFYNSTENRCLLLEIYNGCLVPANPDENPLFDIENDAPYCLELIDPPEGEDPDMEDPDMEDPDMEDPDMEDPDMEDPEDPPEPQP